MARNGKKSAAADTQGKTEIAPEKVLGHSAQIGQAAEAQGVHATSKGANARGQGPKGDGSAPEVAQKAGRKRRGQTADAGEGHNVTAAATDRDMLLANKVADLLASKKVLSVGVAYATALDELEFKADDFDQAKILQLADVAALRPDQTNVGGAAADDAGEIPKFLRAGNRPQDSKPAGDPIGEPAGNA